MGEVIVAIAVAELLPPREFGVAAVFPGFAVSPHTASRGCRVWTERGGLGSVEVGAVVVLGQESSLPLGWVLIGGCCLRSPTLLGQHLGHL